MGTNKILSQEMKHDWKLGWKTNKLRGGSVDECKVCGLLRWFSPIVVKDDEGGYEALSLYISKEQATRFLTTPKPVDLLDYIPCK